MLNESHMPIKKIRINAKLKGKHPKGWNDQDRSNYEICHSRSEEKKEVNSTH
jgi:hypothetical protein